MSEVVGDVLLGWPRTSAISTSRSRPERRLRRCSISARSASALPDRLAPRQRGAHCRQHRASSNGFSIKSTAPAFIASTASGTSPCPVITITGSLISEFLQTPHQFDAGHFRHADIGHHTSGRAGGLPRNATALS